MVTALEKSGQFAAIRPPDVKQNSDKGEYKRDFTVVGTLAGFEVKK